METMLEKYHLGDKFMYIDLKAAKKQNDVATLPFQGQRSSFTVRIPEAVQKEIESEKFTADQTFLLVATENITSYSNSQFVWSVSHEMKDSFTWMFIINGKMSLQPART